MRTLTEQEINAINEIAAKIYDTCVAIDDYDIWQYDCIGVRSDIKDYNIDDDMDISYQHYDDDENHEYDYELPGTCTTRIYRGRYDYSIPTVDDIVNAIVYNMTTYGYNPDMHIYIVYGDYGEDGNDENELIIRNARVYGIVR